MSERVGAIDAWASAMPPGRAKRMPEEYRHIFRRYGSLERFDSEIGGKDLIREMDAAGVDRVMLSAFEVLWATDFPLLSFEPALSELRELGLPETVYRKIVRENAIRAFGLED